LCISQAKLGFHTDLPARAVDARVPRTEVTASWQWDLRTPPERRVQPPAQPAEQGQVARVSKWLASRVPTNRQVQAHRRQELAGLDDREVSSLAAGDSTDLPARQPDIAPDRGV